MVLLKNESAALPLRDSILYLAVVGPNAASLAALEGNYNAVASHPITPLAALQQRLPGRVRYAQGAPYVEGAPVPVPETILSSMRDGKIQTGLNAEYFSGINLDAKPVYSRVDRQIDFDWNGASTARDVSGENFSVRWTGLVTAPAPGTISFGFSMAHCSTCDDSESIRVWFDGKLVDDFHHAVTHRRRATTPSFDLDFRDTKPHAIRIEYNHQAPLFGTGLTFNWKPLSRLSAKKRSRPQTSLM